MPRKPSINILLRNPNEVSIWKRGFAFLIDLIIIELIVNLAFNNYIQKIIGDDKGIIEMYQYINANYELFSGFLLTISIISAVIALIYFTLFEWKLQQTIGKMIFKIKVYPSKLKFWQALVRNISKVLFLIDYFSWVFLFDLIYLTFTRQRFFDKLAKTYLIKVK
jgi:uncharacterized RDD family membrane protein YckC